MRHTISSLITLCILSATVNADPIEGDGKLTFPIGTSYQVESAWPDSGIVCSSAGGRVCVLEPGLYKWLDWTEDTDGFYASTVVAKLASEPAAPEPLPVAPERAASSLTEDDVRSIVREMLLDYTTTVQARDIAIDVAFDEVRSFCAVVQ